MSGCGGISIWTWKIDRVLNGFHCFIAFFRSIVAGSKAPKVPRLGASLEHVTKCLHISACLPLSRSYGLSYGNADRQMRVNTLHKECCPPSHPLCPPSEHRPRRCCLAASGGSRAPALGPGNSGRRAPRPESHSFASACMLTLDSNWQKLANSHWSGGRSNGLAKSECRC